MVWALSRTAPSRLDPVATGHHDWQHWPGLDCPAVLIDSLSPLSVSSCIRSSGILISDNNWECDRDRGCGLGRTVEIVAMILALDKVVPQYPSHLLGMLNRGADGRVRRLERRLLSEALADLLSSCQEDSLVTWTKTVRLATEHGDAAPRLEVEAYPGRLSELREADACKLPAPSGAGWGVVKSAMATLYEVKHSAGTSTKLPSLDQSQRAWWGQRGCPVPKPLQTLSPRRSPHCNITRIMP